MKKTSRQIFNVVFDLLATIVFAVAMISLVWTDQWASLFLFCFLYSNQCKQQLLNRKRIKDDEFNSNAIVVLCNAVGKIAESVLGPQPKITCPVCKMTSYHIKDVEFEYCGKCNKFHSEMRKEKP